MLLGLSYPFHRRIFLAWVEYSISFIFLHTIFLKLQNSPKKNHLGILKNYLGCLKKERGEHTCRFLGPNAHVLNQHFSGRGLVICLTSPASVLSCQERLGNSAYMSQSNPRGDIQNTAEPGRA